MKNIQKLADEIFKAPTKYDLLQRKKMSRTEFDDWIRKHFIINSELREKLLNLFSKGGFAIEAFEDKERHKMIDEEFSSLSKKKLGIALVRSSDEFSVDWADVIEAKYGNESIVAISRNSWDKIFLLSSNSSFVLAS